MAASPNCRSRSSRSVLRPCFASAAAGEDAGCLGDVIAPADDLEVVVVGECLAQVAEALTLAGEVDASLLLFVVAHCVVTPTSLASSLAAALSLRTDFSVSISSRLS